MAHERLDPFIRKVSPLYEPVKRPKATWVEPVIEGRSRLQYGEGEQPAARSLFKGVREDREVPPAPPACPHEPRDHGRPTQTGVPRENILQLLPEAVPPSKEALAAYWARVWKRALAPLGRRPLKLVRHVRGTTCYHKGPLPPVPEKTMHRLTIEKREGGRHAVLGQ